MDTPTARPVAPARDGAAAEDGFSIGLRLRENYVQVVDFDLTAVTPLVVDETAPLGWEEGPDPKRLLGAAVGGCLGASLLFCLRKAHIEVHNLRTTVEGTVVRNEHGRLRIAGLRVLLHPDVHAADRDRMARCQSLFEDFCVVTESVRHGIPVDVRVEPADVAPA